MFHKQIAQGVTLLDTQWGLNWIRRIDTDELAISKSDRCVLGQLGGSYIRMRKRLGLSDQQSCQHGFNVPGWPCFTGPFALLLVPIMYAVLTREWKKEIRLLQMEHGRMRPDLTENRQAQARLESLTALPSQREFALAGR